MLLIASSFSFFIVFVFTYLTNDDFNHFHIFWMALFFAHLLVLPGLCAYYIFFAEMWRKGHRKYGRYLCFGVLAGLLNGMLIARAVMPSSYGWENIWYYKDVLLAVTMTSFLTVILHVFLVKKLEYLVQKDLYAEIKLLCLLIFSLIVLSSLGTRIEEGYRREQKEKIENTVLSSTPCDDQTVIVKMKKWVFELPRKDTDIKLRFRQKKISGEKYLQYACAVKSVTNVRSFSVNGLSLRYLQWSPSWGIVKLYRQIRRVLHRDVPGFRTTSDLIQTVTMKQSETKYIIFPTSVMTTGDGEPVVFYCGVRNCRTRYILPEGLLLSYRVKDITAPQDLIEIDRQKRAEIKAFFYQGEAD